MKLQKQLNERPCVTTTVPNLPKEIGLELKLEKSASELEAVDFNLEDALDLRHRTTLLEEHPDSSLKVVELLNRLGLNVLTSLERSTARVLIEEPSVIMVLEILPLIVHGTELPDRLVLALTPLETLKPSMTDLLGWQRWT